MKHYTLFLLFTLFSAIAGAQVYYPVTHTSGTQTIGINNVTVTGLGAVYTPGISCGVGPYGIGLGNQPGGFLYQFSTPINRIRARFYAFHNSESYVVFANGVQHLITTPDVSLTTLGCPATSVLPTVTSTGVVINANPGTSPTVDCIHQLDILFSTPIDSVRLWRLLSGGGGACIHDFQFSYDTLAMITQPFIDTVKCPSDSVHVAFTTVPNFLPGNVFTLQLSNASGSFATPVNIGTLAATTGGTIKGKLPSAAPGTGYRLRIVSTNPARISGDNGVNIKVVNSLGSVLAASNSPICEDATLNLFASGSLPNTDYNWTGPNSYTSIAQNPSITGALPTHSGDYVVTASLNGCSVKDTVTVLVKPKPAIPTANNNGPVCEGAPINLTANSTTPGSLYSWTGPNSFTAATQNPTIATTVLAHTGTFNVTATLNGCTSAAGTTSVTIKPYPAVPTATNNTPICAGADLTLTANSSTAGVTYSWTGPNGFASTSPNPTINAATQKDAGTYKVNATLNGCTSADASTVPVINIVSSIGGWASPSDTVCTGSTVTFVVVPTNPGPNPTYQWYKNGAPISGANSTLYVTSAVSDGDSFYCQMIAPNVCANTLNLHSNGIKMHVLPITTTPTIDISANPSAPLPGKNILFMAHVLNGGYKPTFQWQRNGQNVIGAIHANWSASSLHPNDKINCVVESSDPCATPKTAYSDTMVVNFPTAINDVNNGELSLYPNPNNGSFVVNIPPTPFKGGNLRVDVVDAVGRTVYRAEEPANRSTFDIALPASVANGVYMLKLRADEETHTLRFTVNR